MNWRRAGALGLGGLTAALAGRSLARRARSEPEGGAGVDVVGSRSEPEVGDGVVDGVASGDGSVVPGLSLAGGAGVDVVGSRSEPEVGDGVVDGVASGDGSVVPGLSLAGGAGVDVVGSRSEPEVGDGVVDGVASGDGSVVPGLSLEGGAGVDVVDSSISEQTYSEVAGVSSGPEELRRHDEATGPRIEYVEGERPRQLAPLNASAPELPPLVAALFEGPPSPGSATPDSNVAPGPRRRFGRWQIIGLVVGLLVVGVIIAGSFIRLPYYRVDPGAVYDTIGRVDAPGEVVFLPDGEIGFVTVAQTADITVWQWFDARLDESVDIRHVDEVRGDQSADEHREADRRRMQLSKNDAVVVAIERLGYDLVVTPLGIEVASVFACTAAEGTLGTGDMIVGVNGEEVRDSTQLGEEMSLLAVGDRVELIVERIDPNNPAQSIATELVGLTLGSADDACLADDVRADEARPFIGIGIHNIVDEELPIDVDIDTGRVGGPSAGLAFTLAIMDVLSEGELTGGLKIVATGSIGRDGSIGPVGGIRQKTFAAERSGADVFIVPMCCSAFVDSVTGEPVDVPSNFDEAQMYADDIVVIGVDTLDDALRAIGELGGDVDQFFVE